MYLLKSDPVDIGIADRNYCRNEVVSLAGIVLSQKVKGAINV